MDVHTPEQRRLNMSRIRGRDTKPELLVRHGLHARGFRYRLHRRDLPGRPDLVLPARRAVIFVHGCFWHDHGCRLCRLPSTRPDFWQEKLRRNRERDAMNVHLLATAGWRVLTIWECSLRGPSRLKLDAVFDQVSAFLLSATPGDEVAGSLPS